MKRKDLKNIRSLHQLELARLDIAISLHRKRIALEKDVENVHNMFRPISLLGAGWSLLAPSSVPLSRILLGVVRTLKARVKSF